MVDYIDFISNSDFIYVKNSTYLFDFSEIVVTFVPDKNAFLAQLVEQLIRNE